MPMNFEDFISIPLPRDEDIVYILCFKCAGSPEEVPFYVGESSRGTRRLNDYITAQFASPTDFKVGTVIRAIQAAGATVTFKYKISPNRKAEEAQLIRSAASTCRLLNHEASFNYKTDDRDEQAYRFKEFAAALLRGDYSPAANVSDRSTQ